MDEIALEPYDPGWPERFVAERAALEQVLPRDEVLAIEHAGSTAIPGLAAKPILDIFIAVRDIGAARQRLLEPVVSLGYVYWAENPDRSRMFFVKGMPPFGTARTHHVHVMQPHTPAWDRAILFRDHLRADPGCAQKYLRLKRELAALHRDDREAYTRSKDVFIEGVMNEIRSLNQK
ncbi:MAG: GrpB family protein [Hyphomicrobiaceae bacterium]|nr:GrpB family protein [Hyphomicrobiaceae bacterium]